MPTPFVENGKPVTLEVVIYKPPGSGPFPAAMVNHGSTGRGDNQAAFARTWTSEHLARLLNDHGWLVAFPQRRGRGKSDGLYDEGFEPDRSRYACRSNMSLPGMERALDDLDAAVRYLKGRSDVDPDRMIIGGQSRGGILAIVYAGTRPRTFRAAFNFVGGWIGDGCFDAGRINTASFRRGAAFDKPTLWLYGENDPFYSMAHSRGNFDAFVQAGGKGQFLAYDLGTFQTGHNLISFPDRWRDALGEFIRVIR